MPLRWLQPDRALLINRIQSKDSRRRLRQYSLHRRNRAETDLLDDYTVPYVIDETNFFDDHMGTFAWYLVDYETGEIERTDKW